MGDEYVLSVMTEGGGGGLWNTVLKVHITTTTLPVNFDVQQKGLRDGAWPVSQEAHHCLTQTTDTQLPVWLLLRLS